MEFEHKSNTLETPSAEQLIEKARILILQDLEVRCQCSFEMLCKRHAWIGQANLYQDVMQNLRHQLICKRKLRAKMLHEQLDDKDHAKD